ncbi:MAG: glycosyltransferase [Bacteroidota bacterium]
MEPLIVTLIFGFFALAWLVQMFYYGYIFSRMAFAKPNVSENKNPNPVSVVVCARNEAQNLRKFLPRILEQDYPDFEVLVVDDFSSDDTGKVLKAFQEEYSHLRIFTLSQHLNFFKGKKFPLSLGIKSAEHNRLLLTDADCYPKSNKWISEMMKHYDENAETEMVLGYGAYEKRKGLLNALVRYETLKTALQYFSYAMAGYPYMGTGRNLSYTKQLFFRVGGFVSHYNIPSGDDDLFVNKAAVETNVALAYTKESHTISQPKSTFAAWFRQKSRHITTGKYYKKSHKIWLGVDKISKTAFYVLFVLLMVFPPAEPLNWFVLGAFALMMFVQVFITQKVAYKLDEKNVGWWAPLLELFFVIFEPFWMLTSIMSKKNQWK